MKNGKERRKDIYVTIILTESTTSQLNLSLPHLEHLHPENSKICLITPSEYSYFERKSKDTNQASTSKDYSDKGFDEIYLKISSDIALFSINNLSSSSLMYCKYLNNLNKILHLNLLIFKH